MTEMENAAPVERGGAENVPVGGVDTNAPIITAPRPTDHINLAEARRFLDLLTPSAKLKRFAFQTFDEDKQRKDGRLALTLFGTFDDVAERLVDLNRRGAGVFVAPAEFGPAARRTNDNVVACRACWADLDGAPLAPVLAGPLSPHVVTETSPGRYHAFWRVALDVGRWQAAQAAIWERFDADRSQGKPCGVVRLPGFFHQKGERHRVRILQGDPGGVADVMAAFAVEPPAAERRFAEPVVGTISDGGRNVKLTSLAGTMRDRGCEGDEIYALLQVANEKRCDPPLRDGEVRRIVESVLRYPVGRAWWAASEAEDAAATAWAEAQDAAVEALWLEDGK